MVTQMMEVRFSTKCKIALSIIDINKVAMVENALLPNNIQKNRQIALLI